ncbi:MAG: tetratricopeptide repeat protein [Ignavibacteriales bacterium]|nr:tetratricopeptide repeat protein [Ignavibacteriales bacterium]
MRYFIFLFLIISTSLFAQDSTRSQALKENAPRKYPIIKAKYPSYSLIAGYLLVTEANRNDPFAQHELGLRYLLGNGFPADTVKAIYWIRKAVDQNLPSARFNYGIMLYNGIGVPWNPFEAYQNFMSAASAGLPEAQFATGLIYTDNLTINKNLNIAYKYFMLSAEANYIPAKEALQQLLKSGFTPTIDSASISNEKQAKRIDEMASVIDPNWDLDFYDFDEQKGKDKKEDVISVVLKKKPSELKRFLGLDELPQESMPKDSSAISLLKFAAESGSPEALMIIGKGYERGTVFEKDLILAAVNYLRAYRLGSMKAGEYLFTMIQSKELFGMLKEKINREDPNTMYAWAGISALGFDNQMSNQQALDFLKKAVEKKHISSMIELGLLYSTGKMVERNRDKAIQYWETAKALGSKEASIRIIMSNLFDSTVVKNFTDDITTLHNIANEGSILAQTALALCYEKGIGVKENKPTAIRYYRHAAQRGSETAYNSLKRMYDELRPDDEEFKIYLQNE